MNDRQFLIRRYAFAALQDAFEEYGIEFARPSLNVTMEDADDDNDEVASKTAKARAASVGAAGSFAVQGDAAAE